MAAGAETDRMTGVRRVGPAFVVVPFQPGQVDEQVGCGGLTSKRMRHGGGRMERGGAALKTANGRWVANSEWRIANGEWRMGSGEWGVGNSE